MASFLFRLFIELPPFEEFLGKASSNCTPIEECEIAHGIEAVIDERLSPIDVSTAARLNVFAHARHHLQHAPERAGNVTFPKAVLAGVLPDRITAQVGTGVRRRVAFGAIKLQRTRDGIRIQAVICTGGEFVYLLARA